MLHLQKKNRPPPVANSRKWNQAETPLGLTKKPVKDIGIEISENGRGLPPPTIFGRILTPPTATNFQNFESPLTVFPKFHVFKFGVIFGTNYGI